MDIVKHRDEWTRRVRERRALADKIAVKKVATIVESTASAPPPQGGGSYTGHQLELYLTKIPGFIGDAYAEGLETVREGDSKDAVAAGRQIVGVLEQILVQLSKWLDPEYFKERPVRDYYSELIAQRAAWNRLLIEPKESGNRARTGAVETLERTIVDLRQAIQSLVEALGKAYLDDFDYAAWAATLPGKTRFWTQDI